MLSDVQLSTMGLDLGDKYSYFCALDEGGEIVGEGRVRTTPEVLTDWFSKIKPTGVAIEAGSLSPWVSRVVTDCGHEVIVANPRKVRLIGQNRKKTDRTDAELLARLARSDPKLLSPIRHRGKEAQADLCSIRSRDMLVKTRTSFINHVRSLLKGFGIRVPKCSARSFHKTVSDFIPDQLRPAVAFIVENIATLTAQINAFDKHVKKLAEKRYPETASGLQVGGVGPLTALAYVLTIEDPTRFAKSRAVGPFFGLCPRSDRSSEYNPQLRISKEGNDYMRRLLIGSAQYILGPFGPPCDLREWGLALIRQGGKKPKKRAAVAVARRLSVLLHRLWVSGETYEPFRHGKPPAKEDQAA